MMLADFFFPKEVADECPINHIDQTLESRKKSWLRDL